MALPDSGSVEDYTEAEMAELVKLNETDKSKLTKNQKAAIARYNFKKGKGEPIPFKGSGVAAAPAPAGAAAPAAAAGMDDIIKSLPPEIQALAARDPASLSKDEKIALAKAKSQAVRAQAAAGKPAEPEKPKGPTPEELAAQKALTFAWAKELDGKFGKTEPKGEGPTSRSSLGPAIDAWGMQTQIPYATVKPERILDVVRYLQMEMGFDQLRDLAGTDYPPTHLEVVYNLTSHEGHRHIALKAKVPRQPAEGMDLPALPSVSSVFKGADWLEREVYDLLGIRFLGHPYMVRLMLPEGWVGHPLRKDYDLKTEQFVGLDEKGNDIVSFRSEDGW